VEGLRRDPLIHGPFCGVQERPCPHDLRVVGAFLLPGMEADPRPHGQPFLVCGMLGPVCDRRLRFSMYLPAPTYTVPHPSGSFSGRTCR
jgi:hypothetical protein